MAVAGYFGGEEVERGGFLAGLLAVPALVAPLGTGLCAAPVAFAALFMALSRPHSLTYVLGAAVVLASLAGAGCRSTERCFGVTSLAGLLLAVRATASACDADAAKIGWLVALCSASVALAACEAYPVWVQCGFALLHLGAYTVALLAADQLATLGPLVFFTLPGVWALMLCLAGVGFSFALLAAGVIGAAFVVVPHARSFGPRHLQQMLGEISEERVLTTELVGGLWMAGACAFGPYQEGAAWQIVAVAAVVLLGVMELLLGLAASHWHGPDAARQRRIGGLLSLSLGIFLGAGAAEGLLQGLLILVGSLMAVGLAVLVASLGASKPASPEELEFRRELVERPDARSEAGLGGVMSGDRYL